jgi:hypothetical protein
VDSGLFCLPDPTSWYLQFIQINIGNLAVISYHPSILKVFSQ